MTFLEAMANPGTYHHPRSSTGDYRVETTGGKVIESRLSKDMAIRICNVTAGRAFVWSMSAKMIVHRNWT